MKTMLDRARFIDIRIILQGEGHGAVRQLSSGTSLEDYVVSALIEARKP